MSNFLKEALDGDKVELLIDKNIFSKDIVLKSAYNFLDKGYFFFKLDDEGNMFLEFTKKTDSKFDAKTLVMEFSDELLSVYLRDKLEHDNKEIREKIVGAAIANSLDQANFVEFDTSEGEKFEQNQIDFDKDIDDILREIENDPELKIDEAEIEKILKEIEAETAVEEIKEEPKITLNTNNLNDAKRMFQDK